MLASVMPAAASPIDDYRRTGRINPCNYSDEQLRNGLNGLPPDVQQYAPGLEDQLRGGREGCGGQGAPGGTGDTRDLQVVPIPGRGGGAAGTPGPKVPDPPAVRPTPRLKLGNVDPPRIAASASTPDVPGWILPLVLVGALGGVLLAVARMRAAPNGDGLAAALRASSEDAAGRSADAFAALWDRLRFR
jgi:hypothetical protein